MDEINEKNNLKRIDELLDDVKPSKDYKFKNLKGKWMGLPEWVRGFLFGAGLLLASWIVVTISRSDLMTILYGIFDGVGLLIIVLVLQFDILNYIEPHGIHIFATFAIALLCPSLYFSVAKISRKSIATFIAINLIAGAIFTVLAFWILKDVQIP